jgi:hypothetical protein
MTPARAQALVVAAVMGLPLVAAAQAGPAAPVELPPTADPAPGTPGVTIVPGAPVTVGSQPAPPDPNAHLFESSRPLSDVSSSGFALGRKAGSGTVARGSPGAAYIATGFVPELHIVRRGDTLFEIAGKYFGNPFQWPRLWALNKQVQNPHWLYPGDQVRLRSELEGAKPTSISGFVRPQPLVPPTTVFQRNVGFVLDQDVETWGEVIGSPDDQMMLSQNDDAYVQLRAGREVQIGQILTVFEPREVDALTEMPLVWVRGLARVERFNPKTSMARVHIVEALEPIDRGMKVGPADSEVKAVQPVRNKKTVMARVVAALYPHEFYGTHQMVLLDKGSEDGLQTGNRLFAVSRGDNWRLGLRSAGKYADERAITEDDDRARAEEEPDTDQPDLYPAETYAELIVVRANKRTAAALVTTSTREIARGALLVAREGY